MRERVHINIHIFLCGCFESHEMNECLWEAFSLRSFVPQQEENARFCAEAEEGLLEGCWFFSCPPLLVTCRVEFLPIYLTLFIMRTSFSVCVCMIQPPVHSHLSDCQILSCHVWVTVFPFYLVLVAQINLKLYISVVENTIVNHNLLFHSSEQWQH